MELNLSDNARKLFVVGGLALTAIAISAVPANAQFARPAATPEFKDAYGYVFENYTFKQLSGSTLGIYGPDDQALTNLLGTVQWPSGKVITEDAHVKDIATRAVAAARTGQLQAVKLNTTEAAAPAIPSNRKTASETTSSVVPASGSNPQQSNGSDSGWTYAYGAEGTATATKLGSTGLAVKFTETAVEVIQSTPGSQAVSQFGLAGSLGSGQVVTIIRDKGPGALKAGFWEGKGGITRGPDENHQTELRHAKDQSMFGGVGVMKSRKERQQLNNSLNGNPDDNVKQAITDAAKVLDTHRPTGDDTDYLGRGKKAVQRINDL